MDSIVMSASELSGYLTKTDEAYLQKMDELYRHAMDVFPILEKETGKTHRKAEKQIIAIYDEMGDIMQTICSTLPTLKVYSFETEHENHAEASRVIAKLRSTQTDHDEFLYYTQRSYEMLFKLAYKGKPLDKKNHLVVKTPVTDPVQNYAVHKITDIDYKIENTVMCVMLRGALLPSMILSKEIEEYSSRGYTTPFALFKIQRDDNRSEHDMRYVLNLNHSYFNLEELNGKDLIFADPMNATGGSLIAIIQYLQKNGVKPRSISCFHVISALKGALRVARSLENCTVYTLWMDPILNRSAYIMPGLGDAGDRVNGTDSYEHPRDILQLIADYGSNITGLYRSQLRQIEHTVLDGMIK